MLAAQRDEIVLRRLRQRGEVPLPYDELVASDLTKCEALLGSEAFWDDASAAAARSTTEVRAMATCEVEAASVASALRRSGAAHERARRAAEFREAALQALLHARLATSTSSR